MDQKEQIGDLPIVSAALDSTEMLFSFSDHLTETKTYSSGSFSGIHVYMKNYWFNVLGCQFGVFQMPDAAVYCIIIKE